MARRKPTKRQQSNSNFATRVGTVVGIYLVIAVFLVAVAALLVAALWVLSIPNWTLFFGYLHADVLLDYVKTLIWPFIVVLLLIVFRSELRSLLKRVKGFSWGDKTVELEQSPQVASPSSIPSELEETPRPNETPEQIRERVYALPEVQLEFERIYRKIYGTQLQVLNFLASVNAPVGTALLDQYYRKHIELLNGGPNFFQGIDEYLSFLVGSGIAKRYEEPNTYELEPVGGQLFLRYLAEQGISAPEARPL